MEVDQLLAKPLGEGVAVTEVLSPNCIHGGRSSSGPFSNSLSNSSEIVMYSFF